MARVPAGPWPTAPGSVFFREVASAATLSRAVRDGRIRRLGTGVYTADLKADPAALVLRNRWAVLSRLIPDALIADRSAADDGRPSDGVLSVVSAVRRTPLALPGLTFAPRAGPGPLPDDPPWAEGLRMSSDARTLVDNLAPSLSRGGSVARTLPRADLEDWLVRKVSLRPDGWLDGLRDRARSVAEALAGPDRVRLVDDLVGAVAGTRPVRRGAGPLLAARTHGLAWDPVRLARFDELAGHLDRLGSSGEVPAALPAPEGDLGGTLPFYEAYFSNLIEGIEFAVEEALRIVESGEIPAARPADAHDVLGTYRVVADPVGRARVPADADEFLELLGVRHATIMHGRPEQRPGLFKSGRNRAGSYAFVDPDLVVGTLARAFRRVGDLAPGFARAAYQMFLVSEVHPFDDGNGRVARVVMNAELSAVGQARILIPIVWRDEYRTALRALSRDGRADLYVRVLAWAWRWSAAMPWGDRAATEGRLEATNALLDSVDGARSGRRLELP